MSRSICDSKKNCPDSSGRTSAAVISVIMPCFNAEKYLAEAIESVLEQTFKDIELIIVDDGSTDGSAAVLGRYSSRIKLLRQENRGPMYARNRGIAEASGEFVAFLDADDFWRKDCLELLYKSLTNCDAAIAYCGWQNLGPGDYVGPLYLPPDYESDDKIKSFLSTCPWPIHAALSRRSAIIDAGGFSTHHAACEDYDLWLRIGAVNRIVLVPEVLAFYRHHSAAQVSRKRWLAAHSILNIKKDFLAAHPEIESQLSRKELRELLGQRFIKEGFQCYWKRDLESAQPIFRAALRIGAWKLRDLQYLIPALLPKDLYRTLISRLDSRGDSTSGWATKTRSPISNAFSASRRWLGNTTGCA